MSATQRNDLTPAVSYDLRAGRYRDDRSGQFVSQASVRRTLDNAVDKAARDARAVTQRLRDGQVSLADWQREMAATIRQTHGASAALAKGGWAQMSANDWDEVERRVKEQMTYLDRFAGQIERGEIPMDGRLLTRAELYALDARQQYSEERLIEESRRGATEYRSVRSARDSCPGCIAAEGMGWRPIALREIPMPGERDCKSRCKCQLETR